MKINQYQIVIDGDFKVYEFKLKGNKLTKSLTFSTMRDKIKKTKTMKKLSKK